ncbi:DUF1631 family protein [Rhodanobacter sp. L36]|uniref:DUF1631 family protein n=1 Tax=Rhodanobacter sp. L36 TaxID=1747221 RepID=UPI00131D41D2|nr:DUF1631 family protein [Rhodanobacter sp. L36]
MEAGQDRRPPASHQPVRLRGGRWPARAQRLLESSYALCVEGMHEPLRHCLGEFEQELFALAERARHPAEQQDCFASRQRVLQERAAFEQHFMENLGEAINALGTPAGKADASADAPAWDSLELLDPVEQELSMTVEQLGARGDVRHGPVLYELGYRFAVLVGAPPLESEALPIGPHALAKAFHEAIGELKLPLAHHVMMLQHFESLVQKLAPVYEAINAQLQGDGILPKLRSMSIPRNLTKRARSGVEETAAVASQPAPAAAGSAPQHAGGSIEVLESLRNLLAQQRGAQASDGQAPGRAASADELQLALGALQQHLAQVTDHASRELRSAQRLREELLTQLNVNNPVGAPRTQLSGEQGDTVELVAMLFEQLGEQLQKGGNARALLSDLQLPVLRVAVTDREFFEKKEHPARRLLDTVTATANDWLDGSDDESNRPLAAKLEQLVQRASQEPPSAGLYTALLADIEHHLALLTRKAQAAERRHVEAAQGRERLDQARRRAAEFMAERFAQSSPRGLLRALLDRAWSDVLALTLLRHGENSDAFDAQLTITDQLLGRLPVTDAKQLQQEVEAGLQQIGMHAEEAEQVAQRLLGSGVPDPAVDLPSATDLAMKLKQHQRLGEQQSTQEPVAKAPVATPLPQPAPPSQPAQPSRSEQPKQPTPLVTNAAPAVETPAPSTPIAATAPVADARAQKIEQHLRELPFGSWFEFVDPLTKQIARRKLAWYSPMSGRCLMISRRGQRGDEMTLTQLAHEIASGRASEVLEQREGLLDRAWRGLTGSLTPVSRRAHPQQEFDR